MIIIPDQKLKDIYIFINYSKNRSYNYFSESMLEFTPFNPFPTQLTQSIDHEYMEDDSSDQSSKTLTTQQQEFDNSQVFISSKKQNKTCQNSSKQHNMVKQMIITIKNMMGNHIDNIGSSNYTRKIIKKVWNIFINTKNPNKEILKAMFNEKMDHKILTKMKLIQVLNQYGQESYRDAMTDLKQEILIRMKGQSIKSHLLDRKIQKKDRLTAYILYFIEEQLRYGQICYKFGLKAAKKISEIQLRIQKEQNFIDEFLQNSSEVFLRPTSKTNSL